MAAPGILQQNDPSTRAEFSDSIEMDWDPPVLDKIEKHGLWPRILARLRVEPEGLNRAGSGGHGTVYTVPEIDRAIKVTDDRVEARSALTLMRRPMDEAYHVYDVFQVEGFDIYVIFCELLEKPDYFFGREFNTFGHMFGYVLNKDNVNSYSAMIAEMLADMEKKGEQMNEEDLANYESFISFLHKLVDGLDERGITFKDVQKGNIMKRPDGQHVLIDIGHKSKAPFVQLEKAQVLEALAEVLAAVKNFTIIK